MLSGMYPLVMGIRSAIGSRALAMRSDKNASRLAATDRHIADLRRSKAEARAEHDRAQQSAAEARRAIKRSAQSAKWTDPVFLVTAQIKHPKLMANARKLLEKRKLNNAANREIERRLLTNPK
jgi:hypothetical protein